LQQAHANRGHGVAGGEDQGHEELIPYGHEIEDGDGNNRGLDQGEHDLPEGPGMATPIDVGGLLVGPGQGGEKVQQIDGGIGDPKHDIEYHQQDPALDAPAHSQGIQGHDDHNGGDAHCDDESDADGLAAGKLPAGQHIGAGSGDQQYARAGDNGVDQAVEEIQGYILRIPGDGVVLPFEALGEIQDGTG